MSSGPQYQPAYPPSLAHVPEVEFAYKDPVRIKSEIIADYEAAYLGLTNIAKTLAPADPIRMLLLTIAQLIVQLRVAINFTGQMNLLSKSVGDFLTALAALYGPRADRVPAHAANTSLEFTLTALMTVDAVIEVGTQAGAANEIIFATTETLIIPALRRSGQVPAECITPGRIGNGYFPGQVSSLVNWNQPFGVNVRNITETAGGAESEEDDRFRYRTWLTPESFSTCGPRDGYRYFALQAHPDIIQCVVESFPRIAGEVWLYPLMRGGQVPDQRILDLVLANCRDRDRRPVADKVSAFFPELVEYQVHIEWWALRDNEIVISEIIAQVNQAVDDWILWQRAAIGRDILPDELVCRVIRAGAKRVTGPGSAPGAFVPVVPAYTHLEYNQLAVNPPDPPDQAGLNKSVVFRGFETE